MAKIGTNKAELFEEADRIRKTILGGRTLVDRDKAIVTDHFRAALTYHNTNMDGNQLAEREIREILRTGQAIGGHSLRDHNAALGHSHAFTYMLEMAKYNPLELSEEVICHLHLLYYAGIDIEYAGIYKEKQNYIEGTEYVPPSPKVTPMLMRTYINDMNKQKGAYHPVEYAAILHKRLLDVHPFRSGNGCIARLLMNMVLKANHYGYCIIPLSLREEYMEALRIAQLRNDSTPLICLVASCVIDTQKQYARHLNVAL